MLNYIYARMSQEYININYQLYMTDCIQGILDTYITSNGGTSNTKRFKDIAYPDIDQNEDTKSGEEMVCDVLNNIGLELI